MADKVSRIDWLNHGLEMLAEGGHATLKADTMSSRLGISRGSFYWHFKNVGDFHQSLLEYWSEQSTELVIQTIDNTVALSSRLSALLKKAFESDTEIERRFRNWAAENRPVANHIEGVDKQREAYIVSLFKRNGFSAKVARSRAKVLYWAYLGRMLSPDSTARSSGIDDLINLFLVPEACNG